MNFFIFIIVESLYSKISVLISILEMVEKLYLHTRSTLIIGPIYAMVRHERILPVALEGKPHDGFVVIDPEGYNMQFIAK